METLNLFYYCHIAISKHFFLFQTMKNEKHIFLLLFSTLQIYFKGHANFNLEMMANVPYSCHVTLANLVLRAVAILLYGPCNFNYYFLQHGKFTPM